jgi:phosphoserine phosphatase RsbU/P
MGAEVLLEVANRGPAIPPELLPHVFEPFRQRKRKEGSMSPGSAGLGLGLYIVQQIVAAHGGAVGARSCDETGTVFSVHLPREHR